MRLFENATYKLLIIVILSKVVVEESVFDTDIKSNSTFSEKSDVNKVIE